MKKFFRFVFGRFFWLSLVLLIELSALIASIVLIERALMELQDFLIGMTVIVEVLMIVTMIYIMNTKLNSAYKITWLFFVGVAPLIGIVFYIFFGNKKISKRVSKKLRPLKKASEMIKSSPSIEEELANLPGGLIANSIANYLQNESGPNIVKNTESIYYPLADDVYPILKDAIKNAKHYVFIEFFIIKKGIMWDEILELLEEKASEGLDVRLIYDDFGSVSTMPHNLPKILAKKNIKCLKFNPLKPLISIKLQNRDHRKIVVIDGYIGFTGGFNIADECINKKERFGHWKDNAVMIKGEAVYGLTTLFLANWVSKFGNYEELSDPRFEYRYYLPKEIKIKSDGYVLPYGTLPFINEPVGERVYLNIAHNANKYLYITTPYLIPDDELISALISAAKKNVEVIILTPHIPDKKIVFGVTRSFYKRLILSGVKIYEYSPGFVHAKMFITDDIFATIGTSNLDYRSLYLNLENGVFLYNTSSILKMKNDFLETLKISEEITLSKYQKFSRIKRFWWKIFRIFAPLM